MPESLLAASSVKLFGRLIEDKTLIVDTTKIGNNLGQSLGCLPAGTTGKPARIYGFSFEGQYFDLARPAIFLVHDGGKAAKDAATQTGLAIKEPELLDDVLVWEYDRDDFLLRIDVEVGPLERILLEAEIGPDQIRGGYGGQNVRAGFAGQNVRLRYAGQNVRLHGGGRGGGMSD